jgi:hypothetical protein
MLNEKITTVPVIPDASPVPPVRFAPDIDVWGRSGRTIGKLIYRDEASFYPRGYRFYANDGVLDVGITHETLAQIAESIQKANAAVAAGLFNRGQNV